MAFFVAFVFDLSLGLTLNGWGWCGETGVVCVILFVSLFMLPSLILSPLFHAIDINSMFFLLVINNGSGFSSSPRSSLIMWL